MNSNTKSSEGIKKFAETLSKYSQLALASVDPALLAATALDEVATALEQGDIVTAQTKLFTVTSRLQTCLPGLMITPGLPSYYDIVARSGGVEPFEELKVRFNPKYKG